MSKFIKSPSKQELIEELAELKAQNRYIRQSRIIYLVTTAINNLFKYGSLLGIAYCFYLIIAVLAGKTTLANIGISFLGNVRISETVAWLFGVSGVAFGYRQRRLRRKTVEHLQTRNIELEKQIDPNRTSSTLTPRGDTNPRDVLK